jgi:hypothetical protein
MCSTGRGVVSEDPGPAVYIQVLLVFFCLQINALMRLMQRSQFRFIKIKCLTL